jgi:hypothetical protein
MRVLHINSARWSITQATGVAGQIAFGAPALFSSLVLARMGDIGLVADLALAFGALSTALAAASFGLTQHLALLGERGNSASVFWVNRVLFTLSALIVCAAGLYLSGVNLFIVALAFSVKFEDGLADLWFGLRLRDSSAEIAMRSLLRWSLARLAVFTTCVLLSLLAGVEAVLALLYGAIAQLVIAPPWVSLLDASDVTPRLLRRALALARATVHFSVASGICGALVTAPRGLAKIVLPASEHGYIGVVFLASTLIGMTYNVAWLRLAGHVQKVGLGAALRRYIGEGLIIAAVLVVGLWLCRAPVARIYGIHGPQFGRVFFHYGYAFVGFYFVVSVANLMKASVWRPMESLVYLVGLLVVFVSTSVGFSLLSAIELASLAMALTIAAGIRSVRVEALKA